MTSTLDRHIPKILSMAGTFSAEEIAEKLDVSVSHIKSFCCKEGISLARSLEVRRGKYTMRPCMCCRRDFRSTGAHHRMCEGCRQGSMTVFDVVQRGRP